MKFKSIAMLFLVLHAGNVFSAQHHWTRTNPGGGGEIAVVGATADGTLIAAADLSGVYRKRNNESQWKAIGDNNGLTQTGAIALGFHPNDGAIFYIGTGIGLYKASHHGDQVELLKGEADGIQYIDAIGVSKSNADVLYISEHKWVDTIRGEIYRIDGSTWIKKTNLPLPAGDTRTVVKILVHPGNDQIVYALTGKARTSCSFPRLFRSDNGGDNWHQIATNLPEHDILDMDIAANDLTSVYVSTFEEATPCGGDIGAKSDGQGALYKVNTSNNTFQLLTDKSGIISVGIDNPNLIRLVDAFTSSSWNDVESDIEWLADSGIFESTRGGQPGSWHKISEINNWNKGYATKDYWAYVPGYYGLSKTMRKGFFDSNRMYASFGQWTWASANNLTTIDNIATQAVGPAHEGRWRSTGVDNIVGHVLDVNDSNPKVVYMGGSDIGFWGSRDQGASWKSIQPDADTYPDYVWSHNGGANVSTGLSDPQVPGKVWASFSQDQYSDENEGVYTKTGLFKSQNYGQSYIKAVTPPVGNNSIRMYGLSLDEKSPVNTRTLYMTIKGDVYKSINDGDSWFLVFNNGGLKFTAIDKFNSRLIYAGGEAGVYRSTNAGISWIDIGHPQMQGPHLNSPHVRKDIIPTEPDPDKGLDYTWEGVFDIKTDPNVPNRVYVTVYGDGKGLYRSDNAGQTWIKLRTDNYMRGVAITPANSNIIYATSSENYHSGRDSNGGGSTGIWYSTQAGLGGWHSANDGMAWNYGGTIEVTRGKNPRVWAWSPGTGVQYSFAAKITQANTNNGFLPAVYLLLVL